MSINNYRMSDHERANPPPIGSVITFRYQELTEAGVPRFATYVGVRIDAQWPPEETDIPSSKSSTKSTSKEKPSKEKPSKEKSSHKEKPHKESKPSSKEKPSKEKPHKQSKHEVEEEEESTTTSTSSGSSSNILQGITLCITGTHSLVRREMVDKITSLGGGFNNGVTK
jgi:DNA ligase-1